MGQLFDEEEERRLDYLGSAIGILKEAELSVKIKMTPDDWEEWDESMLNQYDDGEE
jgi:hypothetical protein